MVMSEKIRKKQYVKIVNFLLFIAIIILATPTFSQDADREIRIKAIAGLKYDIVRFAVKPGETVKIILENTDDMAHNMVFTKPGQREAVVRAAQMMGGEGAAKNYIPDSEDVLWGTKVLEIGETETLSFTAPEEEGIYPYACTYPGHGFVMYGAMYVTNSALPPLENDMNVPEGQRNTAFAEKPASPHPYLMTYPMLYRTFMPECSPAAIAVAITEDHAYCWDAGKCFVRYSWKGGFLDNTAHWKGNGNALSEIQGEVYFKHQKSFPFQLTTVADTTMQPKFKGYQIDKEGLPAFKYNWAGMQFSEKVNALEGNKGLTIHYQLDNINQPIYYSLPKGVGFSTTFNKGVKEGNFLKLSAEEARDFTITITDINQ